MDVKSISALAVTAVALGLAACATSSAPPESWDGLERVSVKGLDKVYAAPGASLAQYSKLMLDPVDVSFAKNWDPRRDSRRLDDDANPEKIRTELARIFREVFQSELEQEGGYQLVDQPGPDVLRVQADIVDLYINAPDTMEAGRSRTYVLDAGEMTLVAELRDSRTNALIARVVDEREGSEFGGFRVANMVTNTAEARRIIAIWANSLRRALNAARASAPTGASAAS